MGNELVSIQIDDSRLKAALENLERSGLDLGPAMRKIAHAMATETERNFAAQGRPRWKPLEETTLLNRARSSKRFSKKDGSTSEKKRGIHRKDGGLLKSALNRMENAMILQDSGRLASSISTDFDSTHAVIGTNVEYAAIHQFGGMAGRGRKVKIEARPFLPITADGALTPEASAEVLSTVLRHLEKAAGI